jgi:hypothetical protein
MNASVIGWRFGGFPGGVLGCEIITMGAEVVLLCTNQVKTGNGGQGFS